MEYTNKEDKEKNTPFINKTERWSINTQVSFKKEKNKDNTLKYRVSHRQLQMEGILKNLDTQEDDTKDIKSFIINFYINLEGPLLRKGYEFIKEDFKILLTNSWLNDKIINCYLELLQDYDKDIYVFSTYFYTNLRNRGLSKVIKYTSKMDIFKFKYLFFPVHLESHWTLVCLDVQNNILEYRDSFLKYNKQVMDDIEEYLLYERFRIYKDKVVYNKFSIKSIEVQYNGYDCGVFVLMYAKYKLKNINKFNREMKYYRRKILYEIINNKIYY